STAAIIPIASPPAATTAVNGGAAEKLDDSPYGGGDARAFNGNGFGLSKMTDYSRSSDSRVSNNDDYENSALVVAVDEHSNDMLPISSNANGGLSYENCGDSTPEPVPSDSAFNEYLQQTFLNSKNFGVLNGIGNNNNNGRHYSENSSSINNIINQQQQHLLSNGIKSVISSSNLKNQQNSKAINNNQKNKNNAPNGKRKFSWEKFSDFCEKRAKIREKARQIDMKNKALQTQIEANLAKKQKYDEQANYYRLKCLEMSVLMQKDGFIGAKQLAWFNKIT
uniref:Uncharacterized protein n=1 Tax=Romanomermis culicivorax TaxID=13658 RepID=A0A915J5S1_ROMCU